MRIILATNRDTMGSWVAAQAAADLRSAIDRDGQAGLIVATGASQFEVLANLVKQPDIDWSKVHGFHLDEYVGLASDHPASFCRYLRERFVDQVPLADFQYLIGDQDPQSTMERVGKLVAATKIDVALVGIGENGHLAFNDPPADFDTTDPYLLVELDQPCRMQQVGEGWFASLDDVPTHAISMSVHQILQSAKIYCSVPDAQKATAVAATIENPISPQDPATILKRHGDTVLVIDEASAAKLSKQRLDSIERIA
ncbi:Glucosamine-6-phosphate deaminase 1 [Rubripirellula lacrimiformis]|uniref:Glucosamine-6-phosphate deaminase 1 n=1 Tax=Rubripirellula lacrimiformis TaxID=1930273 RepID=A0A517NL68_9BACT|nr:glucosamine-6-phosphate deaminase [Rubripirellula lacrimiformis]QDT07885.1 Glucosamine-6-phosphate deaminase 1 [Rubripirellula lacrimiformis]